MAHEWIRRDLWIDAPVEQVWRFVGNDEGLRRWWGTEITLEPREGGRCEEHSWEDGKRRTMRGVVTAYEPPQHLALTWQADDTAWPALTTVSITLAQERNGTRVTVVHRAFGDVAALSTVPLREEATLPRPVAPTRRGVEASLAGATARIGRGVGLATVERRHGPERVTADLWQRRTGDALAQRLIGLSGLFADRSAAASSPDGANEN